MKTYGDTLDDQIRAYRLVANPRVIKDEHGKWAKVDPHLGDPGMVADADSYFISGEFMQLVDAASATIPDGSRVQPEDFPTEAGWMTFSRPPSIEWVQKGAKAVFASDRENPNQSFNDMEARLTEHPPSGLFWYTRGELAMFWLFSDTFQAPVSILGFLVGDNEGKTEPTGMERWIKTLWTLLSQNVAEAATIEAPREVRRRADRERRRRDAIIRVVRLPRRVREEASAEHGSVEWQSRWIVRGHWRNQPWGPERKRIRPVWIAPYVKGPEDKPLKPVAHRLFVADAPPENA